MDQVNIIGTRIVPMDKMKRHQNKFYGQIQQSGNLKVFSST